MDFKLREVRQRFYTSKQWKQLRSAVLSLKPLCVHCSEHDTITIATEVDHIIDIIDNPSLRLTYSNLQPLCKSCHSIKTSQAQFLSDKDLKPAKLQITKPKILKIK